MPALLREVPSEATAESARGRWRWLEGTVVVIVASLVGLVLFPRRIGSHDPHAYEIGDRANLLAHYQWLSDYRHRHAGVLPVAGGYRFVLASWTEGVCEHTRENLARFFTPGPASSNDLHYQDMLRRLQRGEDPMPSLADTTSADTGYVGLAADHPRGAAALDSGVALMADDNEGGWSLRTGAITVLFADGAVRTFAYDELDALYGLGRLDRDAPVATWGLAAPIPACRGLSNQAR